MSDVEHKETVEVTKFKVHFVPTGSAPILKKSKFQFPGDQQFISLTLSLRKMLKLDSSQSLFIYCNSAFIPSPDESLRDLHESFALRDELILNYCLQEAWG
jgi:ubiquitin-like protein ATG12